MSAANVLARHRKIGFQFSGGRDSLAALYLMEPYWKAMTVYHLDNGDQYPELKAVVDLARRDVDIVTVHSDAMQSRMDFGLPSDLTPADNTGMGRALTGRGLAVQGRFECCSRVIMQPLHDRMLADGVSLIVRGVRASDFAKPHQFMSGYVGEGIELLYPIEDWTDDQVGRFLEARGLPIARFYSEGVSETPECMGCTAWWDTGHLQYLAKFYPARFENTRRSILLIRAEVDRQYAQLKEHDHG